MESLVASSFDIERLQSVIDDYLEYSRKSGQHTHSFSWLVHSCFVDDYKLFVVLCAAQSTACSMSYDEYQTFRASAPSAELELLEASRPITVPA